MTDFNTPARCIVCHFCTISAYAMSKHNCDDYAADSYGHCPGFPICDHTADACADYAEVNETSLSYRGYLIRVSTSSVWVDDDNVRTYWDAAVIDVKDVPPVSRQIRRTDAQATLTAARNEIDYVLIRHALRNV